MNQRQVLRHYWDIHGQTVYLRDEVVKQLSTLVTVNNAISDSPLHSCYLWGQGDDEKIMLNKPGYFSWRIVNHDNHCLIEGSTQGHCIIHVKNTLKEGQYRLVVSNHQLCWFSLVIVTPKRCYLPSTLMEGNKCWGLCAQLYSVKSQQNWGMGDFGDLKQLITYTAKLGGDFVGINPLHALDLSYPEDASPYQPLSRYFIHPLYIQVDAIEAFLESDEAQQWWNTPSTQLTRSQCQQSEYVTYKAVCELKLIGLAYAYQHFKNSASMVDRQREFAIYCAGATARLRHYAHHQAQRFKIEPLFSDALLPFKTNLQSPDFILWLQWIAERQLLSCQALCQSLHMSIGLYGDLAIGSAETSVDVAYQPDYYCLSASIGAPPDPLGPLGQVWGLPPYYPDKLEQVAYQNMTTLFETTMRFFGALRIDHMMGFSRLWWVPKGKHATDGGYITYNEAALFKLLALASQSHQCMVIGENLGLQPPDFLSTLHEHFILGYQVLYFQKDHHGHFIAPKHFDKNSLTMVSTHDLPTLAGFWHYDDLQRAKQFSLYSQEQLQTLVKQRSDDRFSLVNRWVLPQIGLMNKSVALGLDELPFRDLLQGIYLTLSTSSSQLLGVQLEDILGVVSPVNIPGTVNQYPNWRRKLPINLEEIVDDTEIKSLLLLINEYRIDKPNE